MTPAIRIVVLILVCAAVAMCAVPRLYLSYDLGTFLPAPDTPAQEVLSSRLGQGPGAQLIFVKMEGSSPAAAVEIAEQLRQLPGIARVLPESQQLDPSQLPPALWHHRLLLGDLPDSIDAWRALFEHRSDDLIFVSDDDTLALLAGDPTQFSVQSLEAFTASTSQPRFNQDNTQYLIVEVTAPAYDLAAQSRTVSAIRATLNQTTPTHLLGNPVYGVDLQSSVKFETTFFSLIASAALLVLMIIRFRSLFLVVSIALPLLTGVVVGLLALTVFFSSVHGITLAFGFTLLGVAIDYPLHLFTHAQLAIRSKPGIWPTLRLGIISTLIAYGAFVFSDTAGLQQLGVFAFFGIIAAALAAAWLSHDRTAEKQPAESSTQINQQRLRFAPGLLVTILAVTTFFNTSGFNDNLASLTPVDPSLLATDAAIRQDLGVTDIRYLLAVRAPTQEASLQATENTYATVVELIDQGLLSGAQAITQILPSARKQNARRNVLKQGDLHFRNALTSSNFQADAFLSFTDAWQRTAEGTELLTLDELREDPALKTIVENLFYQDAESWVSLLFLQGITDADAVAKRLGNLPATQWIDLKATSETMVAQYRNKLVKVLGVALLAIAAVLISRTSLHRMCWLFLTTAGAVMTAAALSAVIHSGLSLFDLMALTLVAGLGLDYALFYSRDRASDHEQATTSAVFICALSSVIVFGVLAFSSVPVLAGIGSTVTCGVLTAYLLARFGRYKKTGS